MVSVALPNEVGGWKIHTIKFHTEIYSHHSHLM
jgi:hypothetical protein